MNLTLQLIKERRSTRAFAPTQVPLALLEQVLEAGTWAPSGMGLQGWHFTALHNAQACLTLAQAVGQADARTGYTFYGAPCHIIVSCPRDSRHAHLDGGAAMQNLLLMAQALELGSCWINQVQVTCDDPTVRALLTQYGVPENHIVIGSVALGYIAQPTAAKKRNENLITIVE